jgi:hypothetical protein
MTTNYRADHVLARADTFQPGDIGRLNEILDSAGLGRPLGEPASDQAPLISIPVEGKTDPLAVQDAVQTARAADPSLPALFADRQAEAGTIAPGVLWESSSPGPFIADGKKSGHAFGGWVPAPDGELEDPEPWDPAAPHPVIALLDSGVQRHVWLNGAQDPFLAEDLPFLQDAEGTDGWTSPIGPVSPFPALSGPVPPGTHWGHGTFIAGLIRQAAPQARILSMRVMGDEGQVDDSAAINALNWLSNRDSLPDIVLMAFGRRRAEPSDMLLDQVQTEVSRLTSAGVTIVASAGNDGSDEPVYPAAFAAEPGLPVISVGALRTPTALEPYSNHGPWVRVAWIGSDIVSIHPLTITGAGKNQVADPLNDRGTPGFDDDSYAWWSGTSFAAALVAARLACGESPGVDLPLPFAQP